MIGQLSTYLDGQIQQTNGIEYISDYCWLVVVEVVLPIPTRRLYCILHI